MDTPDKWDGYLGKDMGKLALEGQEKSKQPMSYSKLQLLNILRTDYSNINNFELKAKLLSREKENELKRKQSETEKCVDQIKEFQNLLIDKKQSEVVYC